MPNFPTRSRRKKEEEKIPSCRVPVPLQCWKERSIPTHCVTLNVNDRRHPSSKSGRLAFGLCVPRSGPREVVGLSEIWDVTIVAVFLFITQKAELLFHRKLSFCRAGHNRSQVYIFHLILLDFASCLIVLCFHRRLKQRLVWDEGVFAWRLCSRLCVTSNRARHKRSTNLKLWGEPRPCYLWRQRV